MIEEALVVSAVLLLICIVCRISIILKRRREYEYFQRLADDHVGGVASHDYLDEIDMIQHPHMDSELAWVRPTKPPPNTKANTPRIGLVSVPGENWVDKPVEQLLDLSASVIIPAPVESSPAPNSPQVTVVNDSDGKQVSIPMASSAGMDLKRTLGSAAPDLIASALAIGAAPKTETLSAKAGIKDWQPWQLARNARPDVQAQLLNQTLNYHQWLADQRVVISVNAQVKAKAMAELEMEEQAALEGRVSQAGLPVPRQRQQGEAAAIQVDEASSSTSSVPATVRTSHAHGRSTDGDRPTRGPTTRHPRQSERRPTTNSSSSNRTLFA